MADLTVVVLTFNEALHIKRCIATAKQVASRVIVVDSFSTDDTVSIAQACGAEVYEHAFTNQAKQLQWALGAIEISSTWVMRLDADEVIEADLAKTIQNQLGQLKPDVNGIELDRKHIFLGRWIRHGGRYPLRMLRIWRNGTAHVEDRWMDEHMVLESGRRVYFKGGFADWNLNNLSHFTDKHNKYATREAIDVILERRAGRQIGIGTAGHSNAPVQTRIRRWVKLNVFNRLPTCAGPIVYFLFRYIVLLGFLDGREGFAYHVLQGFWYRFLVGAKIDEFESQLDPGADTTITTKRLSQLTGFKLEPS